MMNYQYLLKPDTYQNTRRKRTYDLGMGRRNRQKENSKTR